MRRTSALSAAIVLLVALTPADAIAQSAPSAAPKSLRFTGDVIMWTMAIKPDKTADFEAIMGQAARRLAEVSET